MDPTIKQTIEEGVAATWAGRSNFPEHVAALSKHGVESYRVDFRQRATTYFVPSGDTHSVDIQVPAEPVADRFDAEDVVAAICGAQKGALKYPEFVAHVMRAGCIGYVTWITGRHVTYFGRRGEMHVEHFPPQL